jgi:hypothetical protein
MHRVEAYNILAEYLAQVADYGECVRRIETNQVATFIVTGESGMQFRVGFRCAWLGKPFGSISITGIIEYSGEGGLEELEQELIINPISTPPPRNDTGDNARQ